jgi:hypothetical protein
LFNVSRRQRKIVLKAFFESFMNDWCNDFIVVIAV